MKMQHEDFGFVAGTSVRTKEGLKAIEEVRIGDLLLTFPDDSATPDRARQAHEHTFSKVTKILRSSARPVMKVIVTGAVRDTFLVTPNQQVYRARGYKGNNPGWVPFSTVEVGEALVNSGFGNLLVYRTYVAEISAEVFNFEFDSFYTYYVGENNLWIHSV
jgi:hypothetical protein